MGAENSKTFKGKQNEYTIPTSAENFKPINNNVINLSKQPRVGLTYKNPKDPRVKNPLAGLALYSGKQTNTPKVKKIHEMNLSLYFPNKQSLKSSMQAKVRQNAKLRNVLGYGGNHTQKNKKKVRFTNRCK